MEGTNQKMFILVVGVIGLVLIAGCQESATGGPTDAKKSRLVAAENIGLKKQLASREKQIEKLKDQHSKEIKRQQDLLAECREEKRARQGENIDAAAEEGMKELSDFIMEQSAKLQEENDALKARVEELKAQLAGKQQGEKPKEQVEKEPEKQ